MKADLEVSEIRYRRLFEAAKDGILILDTVHGRVTDANPFMVEMLGYSHDEFSGKELWQIGLLHDESESQAMVRQLQKTGYIRYEQLETTAGRHVEVEVVANVYQEDHQPVIQCNIRDITARRLLEEQNEGTSQGRWPIYTAAKMSFWRCCLTNFESAGPHLERRSIAPTPAGSESAPKGSARNDRSPSGAIGPSRGRLVGSVPDYHRQHPSSRERVRLTGNRRSRD